MEKRMEIIDLLRAFGILGVILIHSVYYFDRLDGFGPLQAAAIYLDFIAAYAVPLFLFVSGFLLVKRYPALPDLKSFYLRRFRATLPHYLVFSLFYLVFFHLILSAWSLSSGDVARKLLLGESSYHLWFFIVLFELYLLYPVILRVYRRWTAPLIVISAILAMFWPIISGGAPFFAAFLLYFVLGMWAADNREIVMQGIRDLKKRWIYLAVAAIVLLNLARCLPIFIGLLQGHGYYAIPFELTSIKHLLTPALIVVSIGALVVLAYRVSETPAAESAQWLTRLGRYAFGIYLVHVFFNVVIVKVLRMSGISWDSALFYPVVFIATLGISYLAVHIAARWRLSAYLVGAVCFPRSSFAK